jgi:2-keto-4-pentenoate hydratase/2-oxohepta-3-ene-1,7-dioic acid hydratase in catechol pathway
MKIARFESGNGPRVGVVEDDHVRDASGAGFADVLAVIRGGENAIRRMADAASSGDRHALGTVQLLSPIPRPGKYLAIGMNYRKHVEEGARLGIAAPPRQLWFNKQTSCIAGPHDDIVLPAVSEQLDYEVELGVVIGRAARHVRRADALTHVFGYFVANDVSVRDWQRHSPTFTMGKSFDTHGPTGPWIVTADEIADPHALTLSCRVNGELRQASDTSQMIARIEAQIEYLSTAFTLEAGDLIATGTPEGVGAAMEPPRYLEVGDVIRCEIERIGAIENRVVAERNRAVVSGERLDAR